MKSRQGEISSYVLHRYRLIINDDLSKGTQIPYIERAVKEGYQVMVLNTNRNHWPDGDIRTEQIPVSNRVVVFLLLEATASSVFVVSNFLQTFLQSCMMIWTSNPRVG